MKIIMLVITSFLATPAALADDGPCSLGAPIEQMLCQNVNAIRTTNRTSPLSEDANLDAMAESYARQLFAYAQQGGELTHNIPGYEFVARMARGGVTLPCAENIASGQESVSEVMTDWQKSPGHFRNMLGPAYNKIGSGYYDGYWVQIFSR